MYTDERLTEERLLAVSATMKNLVDSSIRDGMLRAVPDPLEACQLASVYTRLQQRIRGIELALQEYDTDLCRLREIFERAERRGQTSTLLFEDPLGETVAGRL